MTGIERLSAVVNGTEYDRIPVFCNLLDQGAKELGMSIKEYYSKGEYVAEAQLKMREKFGYDNLWSLFYVGKEAELLGCKNMIFAKDGPPNVGQLVINSYEDIHKLKVPHDLTKEPAFAETKKCLEILSREAKGKYPICAYITASMTMPALVMGMEKWMELLLMGPTELRDELLEKCSDLVRKEITAYREGGADIILYSNPFGSTDFVPMKIFQEISLKWMERDFLSLSTQGIVYYCGGARMNATMEQVLNRTGISTYYLSPMDNISQGKKILGGRALCAGVINDIKLMDWSKEEIENEVKRIMDEGIPGGNFMFGTLVMPYNIPEENIRIMLEAAYTLGSYRKKG